MLDYKMETYGKKDAYKTITEMNLSVIGKINYLMKYIIWETYLKFNPEKKVKHFTKFCKKYYKDRSSLIGCEVGVANGLNAWSMLTNLDITKIYLVDCWDIYREEYHGVMVDEWNKDYIDTYEFAIKRLKKWEDKTVFVKEYSDEAINHIDDSSLDFCYIDAQTDYENKIKDCKNWYRKVKYGGVIGGHDFDATHINTVYAVIDFCKIHGLELQGYNEDWWSIKKR